jgi:hypothetical protein
VEEWEPKPAAAFAGNGGIVASVVEEMALSAARAVLATKLSTFLALVMTTEAMTVRETSSLPIRK